MDVVRHRRLVSVLDDGVELVADAWHPAEGGPWPVLLQRLPYGRSVASAPVLPHPAQLARAGYAVVSQDVRGRGGSGGTFDPFRNEGADGATAIGWAARLPFADGRVATYGFSYQGVNQLLAAARRPPELVAIAPLQCAPGPYEGWTYRGGCLQWPFVAPWAAQLAGQEPGTSPPAVDLAALPTTDALGTDPPPWFTQWLDHPTADGFWTDLTPDLGAIDMPAFSVAGWADTFAAGTVELIGLLGAEAVVGPWGHMPWGSRLGPVELGPEAGPTVAHDALIDFLNRTVKGIGDPPQYPVRYFVGGGPGWRATTGWPPPEAGVERWAGTSTNGTANSRHGDGRLEPAAGGELPLGVPTVLAAEPLVPYPGGAEAFTDESVAEDRRDVACFTGPPLTHATAVVGSPVASVVTVADVATHDVVVTLTHVTRDGRSVRLATGARRLVGLEPGTEVRTDVTLGPVGWLVPAGDRLRVDVAASRFPAYDRNPQTPDVAPHRAGRDACQVALVEVLGVALDLPVVH